MNSETTTDKSAVSLESYKPSEYSETSWPRIEETSAKNAFQVTKFEIISQPDFATDPMFANFEVEQSAGAGHQPSSGTPFEPEPLYADPNPLVEGGQQEEEITAANRGAEVRADSSHEASEQFVVEEIEPSEEPNSESSGRSKHEAAIIAAREEGYGLGKAEAQQELEVVCAEMRQHFAGLVEDFKTQSQEMMQEYERKAVELALLVARRMVGTVVETQREYIVSVIREAMQSAGAASIETIRVSPRDFEFLVHQGAGEKLAAGVGSKSIFASDETIKAGCVVVTSSGEINLDLDQAWTRLQTKVAQGPQS
jgi:flagellar biosynthesis/type III secretory pathway protein FliH